MAQFIFPIKQSYHITQGFGVYNPIYNGILPNSKHNGLDIACARGTAVYATADGLIVRTYDESQPDKGGYGNEIRLVTASDKPLLRFEWVYGHLLTVLVKPGDRVKQGQLIGLVDSTGFSTGDHLHFGVRYLNDQGVIDYDNGYFGSVDPMPLLGTVADSVYPVDGRYGQSESALREKAWKLLNEKYAKQRALKAGVPYDDRIVKAFVYGYWDADTVYDVGLFPVWSNYTKPAWKKLHP